MKRVKRAIFLAIFGIIIFTSLGLAEELPLFEGHRAPISDFTITPDKETLVSMDSEGKIKFWSLDSYKVVKNFNIYDSIYFTHIDISSSKRYIALSGDEILWIFDTLKKKPILKLNGTESKGLFIGENRILYLRDGYINILKLRGKKEEPERIRFPYTPPGDITLSPSKNILALWGNDYIILYDLKGKKVIKKIKQKPILFSFLGEDRFLFYTQSGLFVDGTKKTSSSLILNDPQIEYISTSPNGKYLLTSSQNGISLYKVETNKLEKIISKEIGIIQKWIFIDNTAAFLQLGSNEIALVSAKDFSPVANLGGYALPVDKVRFSQSGHYLLFGLKDGESYKLTVCDLRHHTFIENDLFSLSIDFETSVSSERVAILDPNYDLYIYNLKNHKVEKIVQDVREELLLFKNDIVYTFFGYNNLGIYNIKDGSFDSINLNSMPFFSPTISKDATIATLGEDGNIWIYRKGKDPKKIDLPKEVKEGLQAEELGTDIPQIVFTGKKGEIVLSIPEDDGFMVEKIENYKSKGKLKLKGPIVGAIEDGKYYLQEVTLSSGDVVLYLLDDKFKKLKSFKMGDSLISSYDYKKGILVVGDYSGTIKIIRVKKGTLLTLKIFSDGTWIILNGNGEFISGKGIEKYLNLTKKEIKKYYNENLMEEFFKKKN